MKSRVESLEINYEKSYIVQGQACDMCGGDSRYIDAYKSDNSICLCSECSDYIGKLPIYSKNCIKRFLIGNIL